MGNSAYSAVIFIIHSIAQLYLLVLLLRLFLPWLGINFNNPISQGILRLTSPLVIPVRRILPPIGKIDTATLLVAFGIQYLSIFVIVLILGLTPSILPITVTAIVELAILTIRLFVFAIIIRIVLSWISPAGSYNPAHRRARHLANICDHFAVGCGNPDQWLEAGPLLVCQAACSRRIVYSDGTTSVAFAVH
mgnify:CR=1 FL=1